MKATGNGPTGPGGTEQTAPGPAGFGVTVTTVAVVGMIMASQAYASIPLMPQLAAEWDVTTPTAAWATTLFAITYACSSLFSGTLADRFGRRRTVTVSLLVMAGATLLVPVAGSMAAGCTLRAVQGAMAGFFAPVVYTYLSERIAPPRLPLALTVVSCSLGGTLVIGQISAQYLESTLNWTWVFWTSAPLLALGAAAIHWVMVPDVPRAAGSSPVRALASMRTVLANVPVLPLLLTALVVLGGVTAVYTGVQLYGPAGLGDNADGMLALRASALPALVLAVLLTPKLSGIPPLRRAAGALALAGLGMAGAAFADDSAWGLATALFVVVLGGSAAGPALVEAVGRATGSARATGIALYSFVLNVGAGAGALLPGEISGGFVPLSVTIAVAFAAGVLLVAVASGVGSGGAASGSAGSTGAAGSAEPPEAPASAAPGGGGPAARAVPAGGQTAGG
jgi:predicted MFS family arabinose efflux permease